ncbi:hypothetical protein TNCT_546331, partial [Trichonephila clavata]
MHNSSQRWVRLRPCRKRVVRADLLSPRHSFRRGLICPEKCLDKCGSRIREQK